MSGLHTYLYRTTTMMKRFLLALLTGALLAASWPTYGFPLLLFIAFVPLLFVTRSIRISSLKRKGWKVFYLAYIAFFIFNIASTWWLYNSTAVGMWFAVMANALLMTFAWMLYYHISKRTSTLLSLAFLTSIWMLYEFMHLNWQLAWPWLDLGNAFAEYTSWIQWYEYTGTFGGTLWVWAANCTLFYGLRNYTNPEKKLRKAIVCFTGIVVIPILISIIIKATYVEKENPVEVVILQPNIDPYTEKYNTTNDRIADLIFEESSKALTQNTQFLITPETVLAEGYGVDITTFDYSPEKERAEEFLKKYPKLNYLMGIQFYQMHHGDKDILPTSNYLGDDRIGNPVYGDFYNSAVMLNDSGESQIYHKSKLVVGVENFPYQNLLKPLLGDIMLDMGGTVAMKTIQDKRTAFTANTGIKVGSIICYESVFGEFVTGYVKDGADFLAIMTNDAWWGDTQGHKQHLAYANLRAIETRRSIARSANTGISAIIDQTGTVHESLPYNKKGTINGTLNLNDKITFYVKHGDYLAWFAMVAAIFIFLRSMIKPKRIK